MKVYTLGASGHASPQVAEAIGLHTSHRQAEVLVAASTKAAALTALADRGVGGHSLGDPEFRVAKGFAAAQLVAAGLTQQGTVLVWKISSTNTPVARVMADGSPLLVGRFERGVFERGIFTDGVFTSAADLDDIMRAQDEAEGRRRPSRPRPSPVNPDQVSLAISELTQMCQDNDQRVKRLNADLAAARRERLSVCYLAGEAGAEQVAAVAAALGVTAGRVYQMHDEFLVAEANDRRAKPGTGDRGPEVCSLCPPGEQRSFQSSTGMRFHRLSQHGEQQ